MSWRSAGRQLGAAAAVTLSGGIAYGVLGGLHGSPTKHDEVCTLRTATAPCTFLYGTMPALQITVHTLQTYLFAVLTS